MVSLDKSNRSVSLLRYLLILTTKNITDLFKEEETHSAIREIIFEYFTQTKGNKVELISIFIHDYYIEINFQALPTINLSSFISNLKSISSRKYLKNHPDLKTNLGGCWNKSYFIATREQMVSHHIKKYLKEQKSLRSATKILGIEENL